MNEEADRKAFEEARSRAEIAQQRFKDDRELWQAALSYASKQHEAEILSLIDWMIDGGFDDLPSGDWDNSSVLAAFRAQQQEKQS